MDRWHLAKWATFGFRYDQQTGKPIPPLDPPKNVDRYPEYRKR